MKKKLFLALATVFFAVATMFNMNMLQSSNAGDVSLEAIAVMAQANGESGGGIHCGTSFPGPYCGYIDINGTKFQIFWP